MVCPFCKTHVSDTALICPACHADLSRTGSFKRLPDDYCPACGALIAPGEEICHACGLPLQPAQEVLQPEPEPEPEPEIAAGEQQEEALAAALRGPENRRDLDLPELEVELEPEDPISAAETAAIPKLESAIPAEGEFRDEAVLRRRNPSTGSILLIAALSLAIVGGFLLYIGHPWDPGMGVEHNTVERDTSMAGFPGELEALSGQDSSAAKPAEVVSGDQASHDELVSIHSSLVEAAANLDACAEDFERAYSAGDADARARADALAIEISNLIAKAEMVDTSSGTYAESVDELVKLGNWLRNRSDALSRAWAMSDSGTGVSDALSAMRSGDEYGRLFDEAQGPWLATLPEPAA